MSPASTYFFCLSTGSCSFHEFVFMRGGRVDIFLCKYSAANILNSNYLSLWEQVWTWYKNLLPSYCMLGERVNKEQVALATEKTCMLIQSGKLDFCGQLGSFAQISPTDELLLLIVQYLLRCQNEIQYRSPVTLCGLNREKQGMFYICQAW